MARDSTHGVGNCRFQSFSQRLQGDFGFEDSKSSLASRGKA